MKTKKRPHRKLRKLIAERREILLDPASPPPPPLPYGKLMVEMAKIYKVMRQLSGRDLDALDFWLSRNGTYLVAFFREFGADMVYREKGGPPSPKFLVMLEKLGG